MNDMDMALLAGLPSDVQALLARPPLTETRLLELAARWEGLAPAQARMAEVLRLFVVTWDPLEWLVPRPEAVATASARPLEIVVYVPVWSLAEMARRRGTTIAAVLAGLGGGAVTTAATHEDAVTSGRYAQLVARGQVPDLLSGEPGPAFGQPVITARPASWEAIGLGAITDFVQQAFGPVELDRSLVELTTTIAPLPGCPACAGRRFKFPADLAESRDRMCLTHRQEADVVIRRRLARAEASNLAGWRMIVDASARLSRPHLPGGLATRLAAEKDLVRRARLLAEAGAGLADDARAKIAENVARWPDDIRTRILAGDALAILGEAEAALAHFQAALPLAQQAKDAKAIRDLSTRIFRLTRPAGETVQRRQPRPRSPRSQRKGRR